MTFTYGLAVLDRYTNNVACDIRLTMDNVIEGTLHEFLESAGQNGWELCAAFPCAKTKVKRALPNSPEMRLSDDASEEIAFIFKKA